MQILKNKKIQRLALMLLLVVVLTGCTTLDKNGQIPEHYKITLDSPWLSTFSLSLTGIFRFLFVIPIGKTMVWLDQFMPAVLAMAITATLIKLITLPLTLQSTVMSEKMKIAQPELTKLQEKYRDRKDPQSQQMMFKEQQQLYAKYGIKMGKMFMGMFLTLPIFIAVYSAVQSTPAIYYSSFLGMDLTTTMMKGITSFDIAFIVLFIFVAVTQYLSMKLTTILQKRGKKSAAQHHNPNAKDPSASMTNFMVIFITAITLTLPAIIGFYWVVNALFMIGQTLYIHYIYLPKMKEKEYV